MKGKCEEEKVIDDGGNERGYAYSREWDATIKEECKRDYLHAPQALCKALDRAEIQN